jgi:hypothetical protein
VSAVFAFCECRGQGSEVRDWVWRGFRGAWRSGGLARPGGFGPRKLFDNFIGRKRDVDGGVLAGLSVARQGARKRQADGHVSNDHFFWSRSVTNVVRRSVRISLREDVFGTRQKEL